MTPVSLSILFSIYFFLPLPLATSIFSVFTEMDFFRQIYWEKSLRMYWSVAGLGVILTYAANMQALFIQQMHIFFNAFCYFSIYSELLKKKTCLFGFF